MDSQEEDYWKNKTQWIDSKGRIKLNLLPQQSYEEYLEEQRKIRELMELNMVLYGKW